MAVEQTLYEKHTKIRPRPVKGRFQNLRKIAVLVLLGIFHLLPFLQWNGRQAVWFDLADRRFYVFGLNIWPQDFILLTFILLGLCLVLFFATALLGRVWCGYACPQTVYTEIFMWLEQRFEGNRSEQLKLARMSWKQKEKWLKRGSKYLSWFLVSLITGIGFVGYFTPIRELIPEIFTFRADFSNYFWVAFYGGFCWLQAGLVREQFCKYICPYARFQGAMFDQDTLIIAYDEARGEPRRRLKRKDRENAENLGFCVDCTMCVQVCPTGIDIRQGLQLECIACAACIDACDNMMDQINAPRGLIRYTSSNALAGKHTSFLRPKTFGYGLVLAVAFSLFVMAIITKSDLDLEVIPDRNVLSRAISNDRVQNIYTVKILNKTESTRTFTLDTEGLDGAEIENDQTFTVGPAEVYEDVISLDVPSASLGGKLISDFYFVVTPDDAPEDASKEKSVFTGILK